MLPHPDLAIAAGLGMGAVGFFLGVFTGLAWGRRDVPREPLDEVHGDVTINTAAWPPAELAEPGFLDWGHPDSYSRGRRHG